MLCCGVLRCVVLWARMLCGVARDVVCCGCGFGCDVLCCIMLRCVALCCVVLWCCVVWCGVV